MPTDPTTALARAEEAERLAEKATPGPWNIETADQGDEEFCLLPVAIKNGHGAYVVSYDGGLVPIDSAWTKELVEGNAIFIASARTLLPALAADVRDLAAENERMREALETIQRRGSYTRHHHGFEMVESESEDAKIARAALGEGGRG